MAIDAETARENRRAATAKPAPPPKKDPKPSGGNFLSGLGLTPAELEAILKPLPLIPTGPIGPTFTGPTGPTFTGSTGPSVDQILLNQQKALADQQAKLAAEQALQNRQSAYDLLLAQFSEYGLQSLVEPLKNLITQNVSPSEFTIRLRETEAYKKRFAANADRIKKGLTALNEATYLGLEDKYQGIMRNYDLPSTYYSKDSMGRQEGFEKLIANDVSATELEDRILTAQNRVINAPAEVTTALKQFYPGITNGDILAYTLDPEKALTDIKRKVTAAEIGGAAIGAGLATDVTRAEELAKYGVTAATARQGYQAAVPLIERGRQLSAFYQESPYTQATVEEELFNLSGAAGAAEKRKKLSSLETAQFSGRSGITGGALARDRAGAY
jgi:hypothetical protein